MKPPDEIGGPETQSACVIVSDVESWGVIQGGDTCLL